MNRARLVACLMLAGVVLMGISGSGPAAPKSESETRERLRKTFQDGNFKDAYEGLRELALNPNADPRQVGDDLQLAIQALQRLNRVNEIDAFREAVIAAHPTNWRLLWTAAQTYLEVQHQGFIIAGKFERGHHRGGGQVANAMERDRVRALQLMVQALPLAQKDDDRAAAADFMLALAGMWLDSRGAREAWRLQYLTDLTVLPDYEPGWGYYPQTRGAPVDDNGNPIFHAVPKRFEDAKSDGERWRWCLAQAAEINPKLADAVRMQFADFLRGQFGVETMAEYGWFFGRGAIDDSQENQSGTYALHTLGEDETIARLATGIKRFKLPEEFNFIKIYQQVAETPEGGLRLRALEQLAEIFENRRQYPRAAEYWKKCVELASSGERPLPMLKRFARRQFGPRPPVAGADTVANYRERLRQIEGNWGRFEPVMTQPAGKGATVEYRFRNGKSVEFVAHEILADKLLEDVKSYIKSRPRQLNWENINVGDLGFRLVEKDQRRYLGPQVAAWTMQLEPREKHFDKRVTVATPLQKPGAYLLTAKMRDGNTSYIVLWVADTAIAKKPLDGKSWYFVADAITGKPIAKANVEFFGYRVEHRDNRQFQIQVKQFAEHSDADGQVLLDPKDQPQDFHWIVTARTPEGRFAYLGFTGVWYGRVHDAEYHQVKVFTITDRPVYRPGQKVHFKFWVRQAKYDQEDTSDFALRSFAVEIHNPKGEKVFEKQFTSDAYGGIEGEFDLPADATLGQYGLSIVNHGGSSFRVEEYKKPEFEVAVDAPKEPVMLGEKITATITAKYYFGSPVTKAKVKYKVTRTAHSERWYPVAPWDWLYEPGYWWFAYDYDWYPGWRVWGCPRPWPFWWPRASQPPELVADREVEIGPDGTVKVEIDTAVAKALHPDQDHQYSITAEVVDQSRRTIVGSGSVLVARKPFTVYAWVDRGYYRSGDTIQAHFSARTLDGKPVQGPGKLTLLAISYQDGKPVEKAVHTQELATNEEGLAHAQLVAAKPGQYRISYKLTDANEHVIEGGYVLTVIGTAFDGSDYRFNAVELIPDKREYQPGDKVKLMINTNRTGGTVLLFARPSNGVYLPPKVVRLEGKSTVEEIAVVKRDMPNFFVEALSIADGKVHTETKEIVVPPEKRVLSVEIAPSSPTYRPGQKAEVKLKLTDFYGNPFVGSTVVAIYDKSVEYISGGTNVPEIKAFFWKWRRHHHPQTEASLDRGSGNLIPPNTIGMNDIGLFGATAVDEVATNGAKALALSGHAGGMGGFGARDRVRAGMMMERRSAGRAIEADAMLAPAAPMGAAAPGMMETAELAKADAAGEQEKGPALVQPTVRKEFADTALWVGALETAPDGTAQVSLNMPENLTTWRIKVWGLGHGTKVGEGQTDVVTRKDLIVRLQAPRFFVQKDEVVLSANVHNYLKTAKRVQVALELEGKTLEAMDQTLRTVEIAPNGEARVDWRVKVLDEGEAVVRMKALTDEESDAMEQRFPCYVHGMLKMEARSGVIRPNQPGGKMEFTVPAERRPKQTRLEIRYSPTLAGAMVDALPYLVDYPYGCTEQTLSRFLPTVITQKILLDMGLDLDEIQKKRTNLNAQEIGDDAQRAKQWKRLDRNPVFDRKEVDRMVKEGVKRLTEMQLSDGGWGWFSGYGEYSSPHTTAYVVHGLQIAQHNDVALVPGMLERGVEWLKRYQEAEVQKIKNGLKQPKVRPWKDQADNLDAFVYMVLVDAGVRNAEMHEFLFRDRTKLSVYGMALFGLAAEKLGDKDKLAMILQNIGQYVVQDDENQTAWLNLPEGNFWWFWYGSEIEAEAYYLKLLARTDPKGELAPRLVKYLLNNRKHATYWNSTRDTALVIEALADFLRASGEDKPEMTVEVWFDGQLQKAVEVTPATLFTFDNKLVLEGEQVQAGPHTIELRRKGRGPLYFNGYLTNFTLEDMITRAGLEIKVERKYYRLKKLDKTTKVAGSRGQVVDQRVEKYEREELANLAELKSGELVEIELEIASKNDYEYLVFEDMKPAGFEPVDLQSGYNGNALGAYMEFRDNRVVFFVTRLARGKHSVAYRMRAETPGKFSALPTKAWAMYAPELKANSDEIKLRVTD